MSQCPFCDHEKKFTHTWFSDIEEQECRAWIDYERNSDGKFLWYAVLEGDQSTKGYTLLILGSHRCKITDPHLTPDELSHLAIGLNKVSSRLKEKLKVDTVHVLTLCEGVKHLHFHLIPRYTYTEEEKLFYIRNYWEREKGDWQSLKDFKNAIMAGKRPIHGMWYAAYHEMKFKTSDFWQLPAKSRVRELEDRAKCLRDPNLPDPFESREKR